MITIEKQIDSETKEVWRFYMFDLNAVFIAWHKEIKPNGKRKWTVEKSWDKYNRHNNILEPVLPESIKQDVHAEVVKLIKVQTWSEFKPQ